MRYLLLTGIIPAVMLSLSSPEFPFGFSWRGEVSLQEGIGNIGIIQDGDILLFKSGTWRSRIVAILQANSEGFGHVGIALRDEDGAIRVIHSDPRPSEATGKDGVRVEALEELVRKYAINELVALRLSYDFSFLARRAVSIALELADRNVPFDHAFDVFHRDSVYCTELLFLAYGAEENRIFEAAINRRGYFFPDEVLREPSFSIVSQWQSLS